MILKATDGTQAEHHSNASENQDWPSSPGVDQEEGGDYTGNEHGATRTGIEQSLGNIEASTKKILREEVEDGLGDHVSSQALNIIQREQYSR